MAHRGRSGRKVGQSPTSCKKCHFGLRQTRKVVNDEGARKESKTEYLCAPPGIEPCVVEVEEVEVTVRVSRTPRMASDGLPEVDEHDRIVWNEVRRGTGKYVETSTEIGDCDLFRVRC